MPDPEVNELRLRDGRILAYADYGSRGGLPIIRCHRPQVWIAPSLTPLEQDRVAAVIATLLLYRPLQDELETAQSR